MTLLMLLSALLVLLLLGTLAYALVGIARVLDVVGGSPTSYLAKLRLGLRAIERETSHLPPALGKVNDGLGAIADGLVAVEAHLGETVAALEKQRA
jgi:hypothetical protein